MPRRLLMNPRDHQTFVKGSFCAIQDRY